MKVCGKWLIYCNPKDSCVKHIISWADTKKSAKEMLNNFKYYPSDDVYEDKHKNIYWIEKNTKEYR